MFAWLQGKDESVDSDKTTARSEYHPPKSIFPFFDLRVCVSIAPQIAADKNVMNKAEVQERSAVKKRILLGLSLVALMIAGSALAADVAVEPIYPSYGVPVSVAYNWTGFYIGANVGGHFARDKIGTTSVDFAGDSVIDSTSGTTLSPNGVIAGMQIGYNWHVGRMFLGLELDANWLSGSASRSLSFGPPINPVDVMTNSSKAQFLTTVRPRVGVVLDRWLIYATGGLAFETFIANDTFTFPGATNLTAVNKTTTRTGETIGGGFEYAVLDSWTLKLEYLYVTFGTFDTNILSLPITVHHQFIDNIVRIGLNYRFPVYWKY
jgi:outer membrane immunogenic protein